HITIYENDVDGSTENTLRRKRRPGHVSAALAPGNPGRRPGGAGNPAPTDARRVEPTAIVIDNRTPTDFDVVGDPGPAQIGIHPMPNGVRRPSIRAVVGNPARAIWGDIDPMPIRIQAVVINGDDFHRRRLIRLRVDHDLR